MARRALVRRLDGALQVRAHGQCSAQCAGENVAGAMGADEIDWLGR
jgi:hypothetical protein